MTFTPLLALKSQHNCSNALSTSSLAMDQGGMMLTGDIAWLEVSSEHFDTTGGVTGTAHIL